MPRGYKHWLLTLCAKFNRNLLLSNIYFSNFDDLSFSVLFDIVRKDVENRSGV